jgi:excisionase family DNA binding protein
VITPDTRDHANHGEEHAAAESPFMSVKEVAAYLHLNSKKVYALVSEGKIPATKVTGKWLFPRKLVDHWLMESSHGGLLTDRLVVAGSDDPLLQRAITQLVHELQGRALISYTDATPELGLSLLARRRADVCGVHWGPAAESDRRHAALIQQYPPHRTWVLIRAFEREQGIVLGPDYADSQTAATLLRDGVRWVMRQQGAGAQRHLHDLRDAASLIARGEGDAAPASRSIAYEFGLDFLSLGWEAYDLVLDRGIYFRHLFQKLLEQLKSAECQRIAQSLGGYRFDRSGQIIWSD